jgi:hypothetical protein
MVSHRFAGHHVQRDQVPNKGKLLKEMENGINSPRSTQVFATDKDVR